MLICACAKRVVQPMHTFAHVHTFGVQRCARVHWLHMHWVLCLHRMHYLYAMHANSLIVHKSELCNIFITFNALMRGNLFVDTKRLYLLERFIRFTIHAILLLSSEEDRNRTVSQRTKPNSRTTLIGEQPNPWSLLQLQEVMSRPDMLWPMHSTCNLCTPLHTVAHLCTPSVCTCARVHVCTGCMESIRYGFNR